MLNFDPIRRMLPQQSQVRANFEDMPHNSLSFYMREGGKAGMAAALGMEGVIIAFFVVTRFGFLLLGITDGVDEILGCATLLLGLLFAGIGYAIGAMAGAIAFSMRRT